MFFFFFDKDAPEDALKVRKVNDITDINPAYNNLKDLQDRYDKMGEEKMEEDEESEAVAEAIQEQEKQIHDYSNKYEYDNNVFSTNLNLLLKRYNLQVNMLETLLGVSAGYISRTLGKDAKKKLSIEVIWKIANIFNITIDDLTNRKLSEPTKDMKMVVEFILKLKNDINNEKSHWENVGTLPFKGDDDYDLFFRKDGDKTIYKPVDKGSFVYEAKDIFKLQTNMGTLFLIKGSNCFNDGDVYEIYQFDEPDYMSSIGSGYESEYPLTLIVETFMETTGVLYEKCDELYKTIKTHEKDFTISNAARNFIDRFMGDSDTFMNIPEDLPFK